MAFSVEDGSIVDGANSYVSVDYFTSYWADRNKDLSGYAVQAIEAALIQATQLIDNNYSFNGARISIAQPLAWPRTGASDKEGITIAGDEVPHEIIGACCEYAHYALSNELQPAMSAKGVIESESSKVGDLSKSVTYAKGSGYHGLPGVPAAEAYLDGLTSGGVLANFGRLAR